MSKFINDLAAVLLASCLIFASVPQSWAGPVDWVEVPQTEAGQQWWDRGSVRIDRDGYRTVLSRFTPAASEDGEQPSGELYVMQLDCSQELYRDKQVNGLPRFRAQWQPAGDDGLITSVIEAVCTEPLSS